MSLGALRGTRAGIASCLSFERVVGVVEKMLVLIMLVELRLSSCAEAARLGRALSTARVAFGDAHTYLTVR